MTQSLKGIKANAIVSATSSITTSTSVGGNLLPTGNVTYDIGSSTARWKDLYLSNNTIFLGNTAVSANSILPINLDIAPEVLTIQVAAPDAGDDTTWFWTWETSTLPYARTSITNSPQLNVPLYKQGTYTLNNFAGATAYGNMTQTHAGHFKWIDGAGTQNLVSWAVKNANPVSVTHANINGGVATNVERTVITVPSTITLPTLVQPSGISYNVSFVSAGSYTISGDAEGNNKSIGPLYRGSTYTFNLAASLANHPFYITTDNGTGFVANTYVGEYTNGVTGSRNNGSSGQTTLVFTVPNNAPDTLYYQCGVHSSMRGAIVIKDLAVETNINGNYVIYFQHTHEGHKTPIEIRPIPSLVNQMCVVYDASVGKFVPQDLATYVENTPSFKNKIREVAGTATLIAPNGVAVVPTVLVVEDVGYLPLINNKNGDIAFDSYTDTMYVWETNAWRSTKPSSLSLSTGNISITGGTANYFLKTDGSGNLSWDSPSTTPKISSITYPGDDTAAIPAGGQTITLTGSGFNSGASVLINGTYASVVTVVSSTSITFTAPAMAAGTYTLYLINTDGGTSISVPGISYSGTPIWSTSAGSLGTSYETSSISNSLSATGDNPITYSLYSGTLPPGSSLNSSTGLISGTSQSTASSTTYSFTIRATDAQNQDTDRAFSLTINPDLVSWSSPANASVITSYEYSNISNVTLSATSAVDGSNVSYSANSLPTGISLSGSTISGVSNTVANTSVLITATSNTTTRTSSETIYFNVQQDSVTWSTPADNTTYNLSTNEVMSNVAMSASSAAGKSITYTANALPTGLSITGANIAGTPTISGNSSSLVTATASTTNRTATRTINWVISVANDTYFKYTTLLLNGETTVTPFINDASANNLALTIVGDTKPNKFNPYTPGYYSNSFDGTGDYIQGAGSTGLQFGTGDFTVELFFYPTANPASFGCLFTTEVGTATNVAETFNITATGLTLNAANRNAFLISAGTLTLNTWQHIAATRSGTTLRLFLNGVLVGSATDSTNWTADGFATGLLPRSSTNTQITGFVSNLRVLKGTALYTSAFTPPTTALTAITNTQLLTCQSNTFKDNSTNNLTITKVGDTIVSPNNPFTSNSSYSTYGSTYFDGTGDYLTIVNNANLAIGTGDFTVECWVYPQTTTQFTVLFLTATFQIFVYNGALYWNDGAQTSGGTITLNTWQHIAVSRSGTALKGFVNGVQVITTTSSVNLTQSTNYIGYNGGTVGQGYISDLRIVKGTAVYTANFTPSTTPLTAIANTSLLTLQYNGGATNQAIIDNSNFNNIITRAGNASQGTFSPYSVTGWSNYFDGNGDYLTLPTNSAFAIGTADFTVEMWVMPTGANLSWTVLFAGVNYGASSDWGLYGGDGSGNPLYPMFMFTSSSTQGNGATQTQGTASLTGYTKMTIGQWNHVAVSRVSGTARMFLNGTQTGPSVNASTWSLTNTLQKAIAGGYNGNGNTLFTGNISNLRIVSGTGLYTANFTPPTSPLTAIAGTILLTCQSNRLIDNSPNSFTLTRAGDTSVQAFGPFGSVPEAVPISYSNYFDTSSFFTVTSSALAFGTGDFTVEFWSYLIGTTLSTTVPGNLFRSNSNGEFSIYFVSNGVQIARYNTGGDLTSSSVLPAAGVWEHWAFTRSSGTGYIFKNGAVAASGAVATNYTSSGTIILNPNSQYISNLRVVKGTALYTSAFTPSTTPLSAVANTALLICQSTTIKDNSTNASTITVTGSPIPRIFNPFGYTAQSATSYTPSTHGGSLYLDGTGDYLTIPTNTSFQFGTGDFNCESWVYISTAPASSYSLWGDVRWSAGYSSGWYTLINTNLTMTSRISGTTGAWVEVTSTATLNLNSWNHIAVSRATGTFRNFVNGVLSGSQASATYNYTNAETFKVGIAYIDGLVNPLTGYISDLRVVKGTAVYTSNFVPPTQSLTNYSTSYPASLLLNFNNGGIIDQHSSNVLETVGNTQLSTSVKKYGNASLYFDGTGDWLFGGPNQAFNLSVGDFTVELWVYFTGSNNSRGIWAVGVSGGRSGVCFNIGSTGRLQSVYGDGANCDYREGTTVVQLNTWNHIALSRAGSTNRMYLNGVLENTFTSSNFGAGSYSCYVGDGWGISTGNLVRMSSAAAGPILGYIDDLRITKGYARYTANFTPPTALITK